MKGVQPPDPWRVIARRSSASAAFARYRPLAGAPAAWYHPPLGSPPGEQSLLRVWRNWQTR